MLEELYLDLHVTSGEPFRLQTVIAQKRKSGRTEVSVQFIQRRCAERLVHRATDAHAVMDAVQQAEFWVHHTGGIVLCLGDWS